MKQAIHILFLFLLLPFITEAKEVSQQEAIRIAIERGKYLCGEDFPSRVREVRAIEKEGTKAYYIIQFQPEGWALIAADDQTAPLIGYSPTGRYEEKDHPQTMQWWLEGQARQIRQRSANPQQKRHSDWDHAPVSTRAVGKIPPMIEVKWNQGSPYNKHCPQNVKGQRAIVGCVAVAMAQAMTIYKEPLQGSGRKGYETNAEFGLVNVNFDREDPYDWDAIMTGANNYDEAARLMFHCGAIVNMDYGTSASGSYNSRIPAAMKSYFNYDTQMRMVSRNSYGGDWTELILSELIEGRPIIYNGTNDLGTYAHAFNLDGFDGANSFHINWGWGGRNNGYFTLENLNDGNFNYLRDHGAIIGFIPKDYLTSNSDTPPLSPVRIYTEAGALYIETPENGKYQLYSISGKKVANGDFQSGTKDLLEGKKLSPSIYLLRLQYGGREEVQKVVIY